MVIHSKSSPYIPVAAHLGTAVYCLPLVWGVEIQQETLRGVPHVVLHLEGEGAILREEAEPPQEGPPLQGKRRVSAGQGRQGQSKGGTGMFAAAPTSEVLRKPSTYLACTGATNSIRKTHAHTHAPPRPEPRVGGASRLKCFWCARVCPRPQQDWGPVKYEIMLVGRGKGGAEGAAPCNT